MCVVALVCAACGDDEDEPKDEPCAVGVADSCPDALVCEEVQDGEPVCAAPVVIRGHILDVNDESGIEDASIVARHQWQRAFQRRVQ